MNFNLALNYTDYEPRILADAKILESAEKEMQAQQQLNGSRGPDDSKKILGHQSRQVDDMKNSELSSSKAPFDMTKQMRITL